MPKKKPQQQGTVIFDRQGEAKAKVLEHLRKVPIVEVACMRSGVGRTTYYRWLKEDRDFKKQAKQAVADGELLINDMSESQLVTLIKDKDFRAVRYWLDRHHPKYKIERVPPKQKSKKPGGGKVTFQIVQY